MGKKPAAELRDETTRTAPATMRCSAMRPLPGVADEMVDTNGAIRPVWQRFIAHLSGMPEKDLTERFARADRYLRDAGVFYRAYGSAGSAERSWPLSHVPVLIDEREWEALSAGLVQRADLLEAIVADIYGQNRLVAQGVLPPALIAANPEFQRPLVGVTPAGGHYLHFCAFEIGRGPDGNWWVLADRTQAPSGAGFALENRVATTRAFSDIYAETPVHRLASFFGAFRDALQGMKHSGDDRIAVLTPGPANETYYEHAYIARYLGFMLLEGEDLTVVNGKVMVRTVSGLKPITRALAPPRFSLCRPAGAEPELAYRHARPRRGPPRRKRDDRQRARQRHHRNARAACLHADDLSPAVRRRTEAPVDRDLVVRPEGRARACGCQHREDGDRPGLFARALLRRQRRIRARLDLACRRQGLDRRLAGLRRRQTRRPGSRDAVDDAGLD